MTRVGARLPLIIHRNIFVVIDEGRAVASDYYAMAAMAVERAVAYPEGLGCMVVIPSTAQPPPEDVRRAIRGALASTTDHVRCMCWMVEGSGFRAATLRAALAGLGLFIRAPFPTSVERDLVDGTRFLLKHLGASTKPSQVVAVVNSVEQGRHSFATS